jgi:hypothetical protein
VKTSTEELLHAIGILYSNRVNEREEKTFTGKIFYK